MSHPLAAFFLPDHDSDQDQNPPRFSEITGLEFDVDDPDFFGDPPPADLWDERKPGVRGARSATIVKIFDPERISKMIGDAFSKEEDEVNKGRHHMNLMLRNSGWRSLAKGDYDFDGLRDEMPNFSNAIDVIEAQFALVPGCDAGNFAFFPILLAGEPGIGKTWFIERVAEVLGVDMATCSLGAAQGSFDLLGTSSHYSNAQPGRVWRILAEGDVANPLLMLDELDKARGDRQMPVEAALTDLLEPRTARRYRDAALDVQFDASKLTTISTANDLDAIAPHLLSRLEVIEVKAPSKHEQEQMVLKTWQSISQSWGVALGKDVARSLIDSGLSMREIQRKLHIELGMAVKRNHKTVDSVCAMSTQRRPRMGF